jgi:hypothetical protein
MRHLEEGEIHAWLDGALDAEEAHRVEAHAAACVECGAAVAEARGLVAGASRILLALDNVPGDVIPKGTGSVAPTDELIERVAAEGRRRSPWWWTTSRGARIAAGLVLFAGAGAVALRETAMDRESRESSIAVPGDASVPASVDVSAAPNVAAQASSGVARDSFAADRQARERESFGGAGDATPSATPPPPAVGNALGRGRRSDINEQLPRAAEGAVAQARVSAPRAEVGAQPTAPGMGVAALQGKVASGILRPDSGRVGVVPGRAMDSVRLDSIASLRLRRADAEAASLYGARRAGSDVVLGTISGQVVDGDGRPVSGANVLLVGTASAAQSDDRGRFVIDGVRPGTYAIQGRRIGYEAARVDDLRVGAGDTIETIVEMAPSVLRLSEVIVSGPPAQAESRRLGFAAARLPAECYVLTFDRPADLRATGQREQREARIRLDPAPVVEIERNLSAAGGAGRAAPARAAAPPAAAAVADGRFVLAATWERIAGDSILVRWFDGTQSLTMRAELEGESLRGSVTAGAEVDRARTSGVRGRGVVCSG